VREMELVPGTVASASIKATHVVIEAGSTTPGAPA
jgi:molybdopterin-binding protein